VGVENSLLLFHLVRLLAAYALEERGVIGEIPNAMPKPWRVYRLLKPVTERENLHEEIGYDS
jgi:hypothetical protein